MDREGIIKLLDGLVPEVHPSLVLEALDAAGLEIVPKAEPEKPKGKSKK